MKRLHILTIGMVLLVGAMLAAFGNVSASPSIETRLGNPSAAILVTPTPTIPKGTPPPKTTALPPSTKPASGHGTDKVRRANLGLQSTQAPRQPAGSWQLIYSDGFETGTWPYSPWTVTDLSNDGYDRKWGRSNYWGFWGLWPAAGGVHSVYPPTQYADNMNTRMRYGPFDLRDAKLIDLYFWLWRDIESCCDYVAFEVSVDGVNFQELGRWTDYGDWAQQVFYLDQYAGQSQVWVAWRFYSDYSITYAGPWVDDVEIWKYVPGQTTVRGSFYYFDRNENYVPARFTKAYLYDQDPGGTDDLLATTTITDTGFFQFSTVTNWDSDDSDPDPNNRRLDLYVIWETDYNDSATARHRVTNFGDWAYKWVSETRTNISDGTAEFHNFIPNNSDWEGAMWIFQDLRRAWEFVNTRTGTDPGSATVSWETNNPSAPRPQGSLFWPYWPVNGVQLMPGAENFPDLVIHELGHQYMYNIFGWWFWPPDRWDDWWVCLNHGVFTSSTTLCAWSEGWSSFLAVAVNNDPVFEWAPGSSENLETQNWNDGRLQGDTVEGRVAGALYDLFDTTNESPFDSATFGFAPIWNILRVVPHEGSFQEFWNGWKTSGNNKHHAVRAIYQNTIDYNTTPRFNPLLPDRMVLQNFTWNQAIDLWAHSEDNESTDAELTWQIVAVTDTRCGVSLSSNNRYVNIAPQQGWLGACDVTIRVSDSIRTADDTFRVTVAPVQGRIYLPIILK